MHLKTYLTKADLYWRNFGAVFFSLVGAFLVDPIWSWIFDKDQSWTGLLFIICVIFFLPAMLAIAPTFIMLFYKFFPHKRFLPSILTYLIGFIFVSVCAWYETVTSGYNAFTDTVFISLYIMVLFGFVGSMSVSKCSYANKPKCNQYKYRK